MHDSNVPCPPTDPAQEMNLLNLPEGAVCESCGYSLHRLSIARCPECGRAFLSRSHRLRALPHASDHNGTCFAPAAPSSEGAYMADRKRQQPDPDDDLTRGRMDEESIRGVGDDDEEFDDSEDYDEEEDEDANEEGSI